MRNAQFAMRNGYELKNMEDMDMTAREYLEQPSVSEQKIECLFDRLDWLNDLAQRCEIRMGEVPNTGLDGSPGHDLIMDIILIERLIKDRIDDLEGLRNEIENTIVETRDREMIAVLKGKYLNFRSFAEIGEELGCSKQSVVGKYAAGLKRVQAILDERGDGEDEE